jgi:subtilase family serine protease
LTAFGGTSVAAPSFAGILALIEQKLGVPQGLGNVNPALYTLASNATTYGTAFHDITTGNNEVPCTAGSTNCPTSGNMVIGYAAGTGYDQATGLGSVDVNNLATAFGTIARELGSRRPSLLPLALPLVAVQRLRSPRRWRPVPGQQRLQEP